MANTGYNPPDLNVDIVLDEQFGGQKTELIDVVLCTPDVERTGLIVLGVASINATANANLSIETTTTELIVNASCELNPQASITTSYDSNVFRGAMLDKSSHIKQSKIQGLSKQGGFEANKILSNSASEHIELSKKIDKSIQAEFEPNIKLSRNTKLLFDSANKISINSKHQGEYQYFISTKESFVFESAQEVNHSNWYSFEAMLARQIERGFSGEYDKLIGYTRSTNSEYGILIGRRYEHLTELAKLPSWFTDYIPPRLWQTIILKQQQLTAPTLPLDIVLCKPKRQAPRTKLAATTAPIVIYASAYLTATENDGTNPQSQTGVIFVTNSVSLNRSDDGREIKLLGFSVGIDSNSYTWSFSATVPLSELSKVDTASEQQIGVDFVCNGNLWRFILDGCDDSASFGESSLTIKGKSRAMLLASPYSSQRGFKYDTPMSARQIAEDELNRFGVPSGFTLDWQLAGVNGWNIPANAYSYSNKTPINSLQWIAESAGGFINAHMSDDIIHVLANYPVPSWEWSDQTPLLTLPMSLITSRSRGRVNKPAYNGVTLYGENEGGIGALVKRTGTSGGYQPPMVTSDLMTDTAAAISRGKMILSDTGDIGNIGISMPLHSDFGVLKPSTLIGVNDGESWIGMVRGTTITGRLSSNQALEIDQSIDVERHFDKESV